jgi:hypothetical protein
MKNGVFSVAMRSIMLLIITVNLVHCLRLSQAEEEPLFDNSQDNLLSSQSPDLLSVDQADLDVFSEVLASGESIDSIKKEADDSKKPKPLNDE